MTSEAVKLAPCPFCKSRNLKAHDHDDGTPTVWIACQDCGANGPFADWLANAEAAWNTRAIPEGFVVVARSVLEKCAHILECLAEGNPGFDEEDGSYRKCPDCGGWVSHYCHAPGCQTVAYAKLARQALATPEASATGRDLNDGFGIDPRKPAHFGRSDAPPGWPGWKAYSVWRIQGLLEAVNRWRDRAVETEQIANRAIAIAEDLNRRLKDAQLVNSESVRAEIERGARPSGGRFRI